MLSLQVPVAKLDTYFGDLIAKHVSPGISVAVVEKGKVVFAKGYGMVDLENDVPAKPESVFRIGSVTKQFTATMIMQLVKEGKLTLDEPMTKTLDTMPKDWSKVTVRNLLNHTSGIKSYTEIPKLFEDAAMKPTTPAGIIKTIEKEPFDFEPGTDWHYNNTGYELLGMIVEKVDKRSYAESLKARILAPLGMNSTYFTSEGVIVKHRAQGYSPDNTSFRHAPYLNMDWPYAAGSIESTVVDLAKWDAALYGDTILSQADLKTMWTPTTLKNGTTKDYGFGWALRKPNGVPVVEHGGGIHGFRSSIMRAVGKGLTVIVLANCDAADADSFAKYAMERIDPSLAPPIQKPVSSTDAAADKFARELFDSIVANKLDRSKLDPAFAKIVTPELAAQTAANLSKLGPIKAFELLEGSEKDGAKHRVYRVTFDSVKLKLELLVDKAGLVSRLGLNPGE